MRVIATAGHVDHGKSTLVRALTGMEPDRWAEEGRRGMTIDLGFAWTTLPSGQQLAFVDVPGHERFVSNMLAGVGPVAAVMFVVAADEGWMPQSAEHLAALDALQVRHGLLVVTRSDLADPAYALGEARARLCRTSLTAIPQVAVSGYTGEGMTTLVAALDRLAGALPAPDPAGPVRLWIDRAFTIKGAGTVVTGTLGAGTIRRGDELLLGSEPVRVRGLQSLGEEREEVAAIARVAVNLRVPVAELSRGQALVSPGRWFSTSVVDVSVRGDPASALPRRLTLHIGSAATAVQVRPIGDGHARLTLAEPLPLHVGDLALLRDPGLHRIAASVTVLDLRPPPLVRRGSAATRARELAAGATLLARNRVMRRDELTAMGVPAPSCRAAGEWVVDLDHWLDLGQRLEKLVAEHAAQHPLDPGLPIAVAKAALGLPDARLVADLVQAPLRVAGGRIHATDPGIPAEVADAVARLLAGLRARPFQAPTAERLAELGLTRSALAAAARAGLLLRVTPSVVLAPGADSAAARVLAGIGRPFTVSDACRLLDSSRRVVVPLLEHLDRLGHTRRVDLTLRVVPMAAGRQV